MLSDKIDSLLYSFVVLYALALTRLNIEPLCIVHQYRRVIMFDKLLKLTKKNHNSMLWLIMVFITSKGSL